MPGGGSLRRGSWMRRMRISKTRFDPARAGRRASAPACRAQAPAAPAPRQHAMSAASPADRLAHPRRLTLGASISAARARPRWPRIPASPPPPARIRRYRSIRPPPGDGPRIPYRTYDRAAAAIIHAIRAMRPPQSRGARRHRGGVFAVRMHQMRRSAASPAACPTHHAHDQ